jgi:hypothetical protein
MNILTITTKNKKSKTYNVSVDLSVLERIAGSLGLFRPQFIKDMKESIHDMKTGNFIQAKNLKDFQ